MRTVKPSNSAVTLSWHDNRLFGVTSGAKSSMVSSMSVFGGSFAMKPFSTITWQVAHAQAPPQSASMPGMRFFTAPSMTDQPSGTSTTCSLPVCSMYLIFGIVTRLQNTNGPPAKHATTRRNYALLRGDPDRSGVAAFLEVDLLQILYPFFRNVVADHALALGLQLVHIDIGRIEGLGTLGDQAGLEQRL